MKDLGVNVVIKHKNKEELDRYVELIKDLNAEWVRMEFDYYSKELKDNLPLFDYLIDKLRINNINILGVLAGVVPGTIMNLIYSGLKFKNPLDDIENFRNYVIEFCNRYKDYITHWEIWNEENIRRFWTRKADYKEYFSLLKEISPLVKEINPQNKVVLGSICGDDVHFLFPGFKLNYMTKLIDSGINDLVDIYNFHPYTAHNYIGFATKNHIYKVVMRRIRTFYEKFKGQGKDIWLTELGTPRLFSSIRYKKIAELYLDILDYTLKREIKTFFWVLTDFNDKHYSFINPEKYFGLVNYDLNKKITFTEIKKYIEGNFS